MKTAIKNIPEKIYLNLGFDKDKLIEDIDFEELWQSGEITWCRDKINGTDIEYYASQQKPTNEDIREWAYKIASLEIDKKGTARASYYNGLLDGAKAMRDNQIK